MTVYMLMYSRGRYYRKCLKCYSPSWSFMAITDWLQSYSTNKDVAQMARCHAVCSIYLGIYSSFLLYIHRTKWSKVNIIWDLCSTLLSYLLYFCTLQQYANITHKVSITHHFESFSLHNQDGSPSWWDREVLSAFDCLNSQVLKIAPGQSL